MTVSTSQNGWPVATINDIHYYPLVGGKVGLRKGNAATVLLALCADLQRLEPAVWPGIWGWAVRPIRGQTTGYSNHASGTAIDWNAPRHGRQTHSQYLGWTAGQVHIIHGLLASKYRGLIRWGADYHAPTPFDPMHFEINTDEHHIAALAVALTRKPPPPPAAPKVKKMLLIKDPTRPGIFVTDFITKHWIRNTTELGHIVNGYAILGLNSKVYETFPGAILSSYGLIDAGGFPPGYTTPLKTDVEH